MDFNALLVTLASMGGFAAIVAVIINVLKYFGLVKEGAAPTWSAGFNILGLILLFVAGFFPDLNIQGVDNVLNVLAQIFTLAFSLVIQLLSSKLAHNAIKGTPVLGKSYTLERSRKLPMG